ncbi:MAG TPA: hypothetical protein VK658_01070 [Chryseolinea sp.]|nr:hypothetical protein [Chryseolinea sp.]
MAVYTKLRYHGIKVKGNKAAKAKERRIVTSLKKDKDGKYWNDVQETAIRDYIASSSIDVRNGIYQQLLHAPISNMINAIYQKHFGGFALTESQQKDLHDDVLMQVLLGITKFKVSNGTKAFSYIQTIIKNKMIDVFGRISARPQVSLDDYHEPAYLYELEVSDLDKIKLNAIKHIRSRQTWNDPLLESIARHAIECIETYSNYNKFFLTFYVMVMTGLTVKQLRYQSGNRMHLTKCFYYKYTLADYEKAIEEYGGDINDMISVKDALLFFEYDEVNKQQ